MWADEKFAVGFISEAIPRQNIQLLMFKFNTEEITVGDTTHHLEVCTNMRYSKRHSPAFASKRQ